MTFHRKHDLIYSELSYKIIGCAYKVHNELGGGLLEVAYQKALTLLFTKENLRYLEQKQIPIVFLDKKISGYRPDFIVEDTIVLELKRTRKLLTEDFEQTENYLRKKSLKLGLLIHFGKDYVTVKRVVNL